MSHGGLHWQAAVIAALGTLFTVLGGCGPRPVGAVLTYQVDDDAASEWDPARMEQLIAAVNRRIGRAGTAKESGDKRIEVDVYGDAGQAELDGIKQLLSLNGILEFRIIADEKITADQSIIDQAGKLPADETEVIIDGKKVAQWLAYDEPEFGAVEVEQGGLVKRLAGDVPQALILIDPLNVNGSYLTSAIIGQDGRGNPAVLISFNKEGARRFGTLTAQNLPAPTAPSARRRLGIIMDNKLLSAPELHERISDRAMISGSKMTKLEIEAIVGVLNAGALPEPIKFVGERRVTN